jgi:hypothetical protein
MRYKCTRPEKPEVCKNFPHSPSEVKEFPSCTYYWEDGVRKGECSMCGECCKRPYLYLPEFDKKFTEEPCPYLEEIE